MKVRAHVFVSGVVQGVSFRYWLRRESHHRLVTGWTRNLPDGRLEAVFEGEKNDVENIVALCHTGPLGAVVRDVKVLWEQPKGEFEEFRIQYSQKNAAGHR